MSTSLYPEISPHRAGHLRVSPLHQLYWEESGNSGGIPVLFIHGGPGSCTSPKHRRFFDPRKYRILMWDQRGTGRSTPLACLEDNTTWDLVRDMEALRTHFMVDQWLLFGGSWGSALALAYAQTHPSRVAGMILRGVFMLRQAELDWFYNGGAAHLFPDHWEVFLEPICNMPGATPLERYYNILSSDEDSPERLNAAKAWTTWETRTSFLLPNPSHVRNALDATFSLPFARIETHYFINNGFFTPEDQLLQNIDVIRSIPTVIIQGRYDIVCPMVSAWHLHKAWPEAAFQVVDDAGHSAFEETTTRLLVEATDGFSS